MEKINVKGVTSLGLMGVNQGTNELYLQVMITDNHYWRQSKAGIIKCDPP